MTYFRKHLLPKIGQFYRLSTPRKSNWNTVKRNCQYSDAEKLKTISSSFWSSHVHVFQSKNKIFGGRGGRSAMNLWWEGFVIMFNHIGRQWLTKIQPTPFYRQLLPVLPLDIGLQILFGVLQVPSVDISEHCWVLQTREHTASPCNETMLSAVMPDSHSRQITMLHSLFSSGCKNVKQMKF